MLMLMFLTINMMHIKLVMHHPLCAQLIFIIDCLPCSFCSFALPGLDDDVEADDSYVYPTQDFDQYQANYSGELSHT